MSEYAVAAAVLVAEGVELIVVGTTALTMHGQPVEVHDLDVVVEPSPPNLAGLPRALAALGAMRSDIPPPWALVESDVMTVTTAYGRVDLMLAQGRRRFHDLARRALTVDVCGVNVPVASRDDAWALRRQFKEPAAVQ
jgi:hypothetical protein